MPVACLDALPVDLVVNGNIYGCCYVAPLHGCCEGCSDFLPIEQLPEPSALVGLLAGLLMLALFNRGVVKSSYPNQPL
jgi:hypothetical protein